MFVRLSDGRIINASKIVAIYPSTTDFCKGCLGSGTKEHVAVFSLKGVPALTYVEDEDGDLTDEVDWEETDDNIESGDSVDFMRLSEDDLQHVLSAIEKTEGLL